VRETLHEPAADSSSLIHANVHPPAFVCTEADSLSDRIAILARGRLACCGSPRFLRARLGLGHHLSLLLSPAAAEDAAQTAALAALVARHAPAAVCEPPVAHGELSFLLPGCDAATLKKALQELDARGDAMGVAGVSVSCPSLEEVFLSVSEAVSDAAGGDARRLSVQSLRAAALARLRASADARADAAETAAAAAVPPSPPVQLLGGGALLARQFAALLRKRALSARRDRLACATSLAVPLLFVSLGLALSRLGTPPGTYPPALMDPSFLAHKPLAAAVSPAAAAAAGGDAAASAAGFGFGADALAWAAGANSVYACNGGVEDGASWYPYCEPNYSDCAAMGCTPPGAATATTLDAALLAATQRRRNCAHPQPRQSGEHASSSPSSSCAAVFVSAGSPAARRFAFTLALSPDAYFALPAAQAIADSAVYSALLGRPARLSLVLHPLPEPHAGAQHGGGGGGSRGAAQELLVGLCVILGLGSLSASASVFLVAERRSRSKHQQLLSGVRRATFWAATAAWDAASTALPLAAVRALHCMLCYEAYL
jgi:hypothetical protein